MPEATEAAPFFHAAAESSKEAEAFWRWTYDGVRIRIAIWPGPAKGTILLFPGRTEYIEKYARTADSMGALGYAMATIDWRGQGLSDRALKDPNTGHVEDFEHYQFDVRAMIDAVRSKGMPEPFYLIGHSMGGSIGLRALMKGAGIKAAVFTAPMWGIQINRLMRPVAFSVCWAADRLGFGHAYAPGTKRLAYVEETSFEGNALTTDRGMFDYMRRQIKAHPQLALGGPSLHWLGQALAECRSLARKPSPTIPALTFLGSRESIVDAAPIRDRMSRWPNSRLEIFEGAEHEIMMESPDRRRRFLDIATEHFGAETRT